VATVEETDGVAVVRVTSLPTGATTKIRAVVPANRPVVLDLRGLVWGIEEEAIAVADLFVSEGLLADWSGRKAGSQTYAATEGVIEVVPSVVLIGPETEGVGEILAAALQRSGFSLIGGRTIGHASHMRFIEAGELTLWLPVGRWQRADGTAINGNGVEPDEVVDVAVGEDEADPVLDRALELAVQSLDQAA
jgi:carboxyl-terminal processing protease